MHAALDERIYTTDDLLRMPDGDRYELIHGRLMEREMGAEATSIAARIIGFLWMFLEENAIGVVLTSEARYVCFPKDPNHSRRPDASVVLFSRLAGNRLPKGDMHIRPDLAVEVVSPNDGAEDLAVKVAEYQSVGVPLIWVVYPTTRRVLIHRLPSSPLGPVTELTETATISGEDVLPGFTCPVAKFFGR